jgi:hypothetical protein
VTGHLLVLEGLAGILTPPVEPIERCETDTPCVARRPPKFQRFMPPAKPLPIVVPVTSTNWPTTKWSACDLGADRDQRVFRHAEFRDLRLGSTLATAKWPRSAFGQILDLGEPDPSCSAT